MKTKLTFSTVVSKITAVYIAAFIAGVSGFCVGRGVGSVERQPEINRLKARAKEFDSLKNNVDAVAFQMERQIESSFLFDLPFKDACDSSENFMVLSFSVPSLKTEETEPIPIPLCISKENRTPTGIHAEQTLYLHASQLARITENPELLRQIRNSPINIEQTGTGLKASE